MSNITVGAQLFSCRETMTNEQDLTTTMKRLAAGGYTTVQVSGCKVEPAATARIIHGEGLKIRATHHGWGQFKDDLNELIEINKIYDNPHLGVGSVPQDYISVDGAKKFLDEAAEVCERLAKENMDFSYHNHNFEFQKIEDGRTWMQAVIEDSSEDLKFEIDTYWVQAGGGDPAEWLRKVAGRMPIIHFKDMVISAERDQIFSPVGDGNLNWPSIIDAAQAGGCAYAFVEQDRCYGADPVDCLLKSLNNLLAMGLTA